MVSMEPFVFISHAKENQDIAYRLREILQVHGINCWISWDDIDYGAKWIEGITDAVKGSNVLVLLYTSHANDSKWVTREVTFADRNDVLIIPVMLEDVPLNKSLEPILAEAHWLDATGTDRRIEEHFERLAAQLRNRRPAEAGPVPSHPATYAEAFRDAGKAALTLPFFWWVICGALPFATILLEYGDEGKFLAQVSPHFFLYPLLIGFAVPACVVPVWAFIYRRWRAGTRLYAGLVAMLVLFSAYVTYVEVAYANPALWDFRHLQELRLLPHAGVSRIVKGGVPVGELGTEAAGVPVLERAHYLLEQCPQARLARVSRTNEQGKQGDCARLRLDLHHALLAWKEGGESERSYTHFVYIVAVLVEVLTLGASVLALGIMVAKRQFLKSVVASNLLTVAFSLYFFWIPFRILALHDKASLFAEVIILTEAAIMILLLLCYGFTIFLTSRYSRNYVAHVVQAAVGLALVGIAYYHPDLLAVVFGRRSRLETYPMIIMGVIVIFLPFILRDDETRAQTGT